MVDLGNINMVVKDQGRVIKMSTLGPCDGHEDCIQRSLLAMENHKGLMYFGESVCHFDEVFFKDAGCSTTTFFFRLLGLITPLFVTTKLGLCHHLHQPKLVSLVSGVCKSRFDGD